MNPERGENKIPFLPPLPPARGGPTKFRISMQQTQKAKNGGYEKSKMGRGLFLQRLFKVECQR